MGVRKKLTENKKFGTGVAAALLIIALGVITFQLHWARGSAGAASRNAFYTDDNGQTFFKDDANKIIPFDHHGKQAYRADVFEGPDGRQFVGLIYRHTSTGRFEMQDYINRKVAARDDDGTIRQGIEYRGTEIKRAGAADKAWTPNDETKNEQLRASIRTPSGAAAKLILP
jgi:hypothetical protein